MVVVTLVMVMVVVMVYIIIRHMQRKAQRIGECCAEYDGPQTDRKGSVLSICFGPSFLRMRTFFFVQELTAMEKNPPDHCNAGPTGDDMYSWQASITGPGPPSPVSPIEIPVFLVTLLSVLYLEGTPYFEGTWFLKIKFPGRRHVSKMK
jgi:hypothetical protein